MTKSGDTGHGARLHPSALHPGSPKGLPELCPHRPGRELFFYATPDILSGLCAWAFYDCNEPDAVCTPFGSGCGTTIATAVRENRRQGYRTFIGLFDPSVRPYVGADELGFVIPASRFRTMYETMRSTCLFGTNAWSKVKARIEPDTAQ